jgi:hypothetical protein
MEISNVSNDIINSIDIIRSQREKDMHESDGIFNPLSELITPEWYYSDSYNAFDNKDISWDYLNDLDIIKSMEDEIGKIRKSDDVIGIEFEKSFCSWYQPYHFIPRNKWGIHIVYGCWIKIATVLYQNCPSVYHKRIDSIKSAFLYLFIHGMFHHIIENSVSIIEIILAKTNLYRKYYEHIYSQFYNTSNCIEESLSNRYLYGWADFCHIDRNFLYNQLLKQGQGYSNFNLYSGDKFLGGIRILMSQIIYACPNPTLYLPIEQIVDISTNPIEYYKLHNIPVWIHHGAKYVN